MAYNIKQITNYDTENFQTINYTVVTKEGNTITIPYVEALSNINIIKLGYNCEQKGIIYPIFINTNDGNGFKEIKISDTGMYEMQPENISVDNENKVTNVVITSVRVPSNIKFIIDYVCNSTT